MDVGVSDATVLLRVAEFHDCAHDRIGALVGHSHCGSGVVQGHFDVVVKLDDCNTHGRAVYLLCQCCDDVGGMLLQRTELAKGPA